MPQVVLLNMLRCPKPCYYKYKEDCSGSSQFVMIFIWSSFLSGGYICEAPLLGKVYSIHGIIAHKYCLNSLSPRAQVLRSKQIPVVSSVFFMLLKDKVCSRE